MRKYVLPIVTVVMLLVGVGLLVTVLLTTDNDLMKDITLNDNDITREKLEFSASGLNPGDVREYTINLKGKSAGTYMLNFDFVEVDNGALKNYVDVALQYGQDCYTYRLSELLEGKTVSFNCRIGAKTTVIKVIYSMPLDTGNEAQNATTHFTVNLTAEKF
ncbi:MAG: hypothetical protein J1F68_00625 [Clostridiales bacterium]|nr:hypothetical protein [Clostridiales bacterium]